MSRDEYNTVRKRFGSETYTTTHRRSEIKDPFITSNKSELRSPNEVAMVRSLSIRSFEASYSNNFAKHVIIRSFEIFEASNSNSLAKLPSKHEAVVWVFNENLDRARGEGPQDGALPGARWVKKI